MAADPKSKSDEKYGTGVFFIAALLITGFSYAVVVLSVHTYCENRRFAGALAALVNGFLLVRTWPSRVLRRALSASGTVLCLLSAAANVWFVIWATHTCANMFDLLNK